MSGFLGALGGLGEGMKSVGKSWSDELKQQRIMELQNTQSDKEYARKRGDELSDLETKRGWETEDAKTKHGYKLEEIGATGAEARRTALAKDKADPDKQTLGGWKVTDAQKEIRQLVTAGKRMNADGEYDADQEAEMARDASAAWEEFQRNPEAGPAGAYNKVIKGDRKSTADTKAIEEDIPAQVDKEAKDKARWYVPDSMDFPEGREKWKRDRADELRGRRGLLSDPEATDVTGKRGSGPPPDGTRLRKNGKTYVVKNGVPVEVK